MCSTWHDTGSESPLQSRTKNFSDGTPWNLVMNLQIEMSGSYCKEEVNVHGNLTRKYSLHSMTREVVLYLGRWSGNCSTMSKTWLQNPRRKEMVVRE